MANHFRRPSGHSSSGKGLLSSVFSLLSLLLPLVLPSTLTRTALSRFKCSDGQTGFFTRLARLIKEKAKSDVETLFSGFSKTRDNLAVIDELLLYWNLAHTDRVLDEVEEALLVSDFGPRITIKIVESLREDILSGSLNPGAKSRKLAYRLKKEGAKKYIETLCI